MITCNCGNHKWEVRAGAIASSYAELFEKYGTFDKWEEHTRTCDYCGKNYEQGFCAGNGEAYACEECFEHVEKAEHLVSEHDIPEGFEAHPTDEGGCYFYLDNGAYEDSGWYWTTWDE